MIKLHLLFVDDEEDLQMVFKFNFKEEVTDGLVRLSFSTSGDECLEILEAEGGSESTVVLTDINMPKMNGLILLDKIKDKYPMIKVFMISAYGNNDFIDKAKEKGATHFFNKPVDFNVMKDVISKQFGVKLYSS